jgi:hypothetical protein
VVPVGEVGESVAAAHGKAPYTVGSIGWIRWGEMVEGVEEPGSSNRVEAESAVNPSIHGDGGADFIVGMVVVVVVSREVVVDEGCPAACQDREVLDGEPF